MNDPTSPNHYKAGGIECIDALRSALGPGGFQSYVRRQRNQIRLALPL